jgi:cytochrome c biogenesis protein CcmG, thiol:disulfide interchange protein DsbE
VTATTDRPGDTPVPAEPGGPDAPAEGGELAEATGGRGGRIGLLIVAIVAVVVVGLVAVLGTSEPAADRRTRSPLVGRPVPALAGPTIDGGRYDIDDQRGRWVAVNFFATWCVPCVQEHPELVAFDREHQVTGDASVVSVVFSDDPAKARAFFKARGGDWPVMVDDKGSAALDFGVPKVPETYLITPNGYVAAKLTGGVTQADLDATIARIEQAAQRAQAGGQ